jgi:glycerophosphoryl diester phosphodiesterase
VVSDNENLFLRRKDRPLVTGHRGVPLLAQENTIAGLRRAVELGIPAVEIDVMVTRDEQVVLFHDDDCERLTGQPGQLIERTWDELSRMRIKRRLFMGRTIEGEERWIDYPAEERIAALRGPR